MDYFATSFDQVESTDYSDQASLLDCLVCFASKELQRQASMGSPALSVGWMRPNLEPVYTHPQEKQPGCYSPECIR